MRQSIPYTLVTVVTPSKPTQFANRVYANLSVCCSQVHSICAQVSARTFPDSLDLAADLLVLIIAFAVFDCGEYITLHRSLSIAPGL